jgi:hypothetical protein
MTIGAQINGQSQMLSKAQKRNVIEIFIRYDMRNIIEYNFR